MEKARDGVELLPGERRIWKLNSVRFVCFALQMDGCLVMSSFRLIFVPSLRAVLVALGAFLVLWFAQDDSHVAAVLNIPLLTIFRIEASPTSIVLHCKDFRIITLIPAMSDFSSNKVAPLLDLLQLHCFPSFRHEPLDSYAFRFQIFEKQLAPGLMGVFGAREQEGLLPNGWEIYNPVEEFERQGVFKSKSWRISEVNRNYLLCPTYPGLIVVPKLCKDDMLLQVSQFRSKHRLPCLTWLHPASQASLLRSSQPMVGIRGKRSAADESYVKLTGTKWIMDARPRKNALGNMAMGKGFEREMNYGDLTLEFLDIENIHVMRESLQRIAAACVLPESEDDSVFFAELDGSRWLKHIRQVLLGSLKVLHELRDGRSVIVHCSDGWDRTSQLCALVQLIADPYFRTRRGFAQLIEKDWLSFGHMFERRVGHGDRHFADEQRAPIFLQFLDCVWQIYRQFPRSFEFSEVFLATIVDELYACRFGTFLYNCEKERNAVGLSTKTESLWTLLCSTEPPPLQYFPGLIEKKAPKNRSQSPSLPGKPSTESPPPPVQSPSKHHQRHRHVRGAELCISADDLSTASLSAVEREVPPERPRPEAGEKSNPFVNPFYRLHEGPLAVQCSMRMLSVWPMYLRWNRHLIPQETTYSFAEELKDRCKVLEARVERYRDQLDSNKRTVGGRGGAARRTKSTTSSMTTQLPLPEGATSL